METIQQRIERQQAEAQAIRNWDGKKFLLSHITWLKGSYQTSKLISTITDEEVEAEKERLNIQKPPKQKPYVNPDPERKARKDLIKEFGKRQFRRRHLMLI